MAAITPIDISSSDSDLEIEEPDTSVTRPPVRILPAWTSKASNNTSTGFDGQSRKLPSFARSYASNGSSSNSKTKLQISPGPSDDHQMSNGQVDNFHDFSGKRNVGHLQNINSRIANVSSAEYEKIPSQQVLKRTLPSFPQLYSPSTKSKNSLENVNSSQGRDTYMNTYYLAGTSTFSSNDMKDHNGRRNDDDIMMYENGRNRILPPSLVHGKSVAMTQFGGPSDIAYRSGSADERAVGSDERLIYQAALEDLNQPKVEATLPEGLLSVNLLRHQKIALAWMLQKETRSLHCLGGILADDQGLGKTISIIALIQMQRSLQSKSTEALCNQKTEALNLDDDDDNGSAGADKVKEAGESDDIKPVVEESTSSRSFSRRRPAAGTLVVCPASVVRQWARELEDKVSNDAKLSVLVYHGGSRTKDPVELASYDVVLTTYAIVTNEVPKQPLVDEDEADEKNGETYGLSSEFAVTKKRKTTSTVSKRGKKGNKGSSSIDYGCGPLAKVGWFRVVLDEAQTIKNHRTQVARACCSLRAKRRWCLSGTPIQNTIEDLYSYFRFLKYDPYAVYKSFYSTIKIPISRNSLHGYKKLQAVLRAIMLRRTKGTIIDGQPIINLPPKTIQLKKVDFSKEEWAFYKKLESDSHRRFKAFADAGTVNQNYANILLMLLRLRQACDHPLLVKEYDFDSVGKISGELAKKLPRDMLIDLLSRLETSSAICCVCSDPPEDSVVTMCGHVFCYQCVAEYIKGDDNMCPAVRCKEQLGADVVFSKSTLRSCMSGDGGDIPTESPFADKSGILQNEYISSKIGAVLDILLEQCESNRSRVELHDPVGSTSNVTSAEGVDDMENTILHSKAPSKRPEKSIIFSQWTRMLDLVENSLNVHCVQYRRLDGTMSLIARDRAVKDFNTDPEITVMLMSLKAGNLGLNMVAACRVVLLDLWWNPTTEDQAVDRAHRIGQTRPVTVTRLTIKDTVEDRILTLQDDKRKMVASAFGEDQGGGTTSRLTVEDLKYLFMV